MRLGYTLEEIGEHVLFSSMNDDAICSQCSTSFDRGFIVDFDPDPAFCSTKCLEDYYIDLCAE